MGEAGELLASRVQETAAALASIIRLAQDRSNTCLQLFIEKELGPVLGPSIKQYWQLFASLSINSRQELEMLFKKHYHHEHVQDAYEELVLAEEAWNRFLQQLDSQVKRNTTTAGSPALQHGDTFPLHTTLLTIRNEEVPVSQLIPADGGGLHLVLLRHFA